MYIHNKISTREETVPSVRTLSLSSFFITRSYNSCLTLNDPCFVLGPFLNFGRAAGRGISSLAPEGDF